MEKKDNSFVVVNKNNPDIISRIDIPQEPDINNPIQVTTYSPEFVVTSDISTKEIIENANSRDYKNIPKFVIHRTRRDFIEKHNTKMFQLETLFINEQVARRNSAYTIKHYKQTFKKLYEFVVFDTLDENDIEKFIEAYPNIENPREYIGRQLPIAVLETNDIQMHFIKYLSVFEKVSEQTITSYLRDFRAIMYYCMENGWIEPYRIVIKDKPAPIKECYTEKEKEKLLKKPKTDDFTEYRNWVIVAYLFATGNRIQTIINIKVGDVDLEEGYININVQKNGKVNRISLVKKMISILREYIYLFRTDEDGYTKDDEYLFVTQYGNQMTDNALKRAIATYNKSRGVNKTSIHLFRHTYAKKWIMDGGDIVSLQQMLGQSSNKMVQHYANLYASDIKEKAEKYSVLSNTKTKSGKKIKARKE
ncbi:MAG: site-specific integrase [Clostridia bacterium]|nr:site-specific integrase [Clostridia bacterium]